jgi:acylphosphatase
MSSRAPARLEATVFGLVQGVYFRQTARQEAQRLRLAGWVANRPDGAVSVVAEGEEAVLHQFVDFLHHGPPGARVERVEITWTTATAEFNEFRVRYL